MTMLVEMTTNKANNSVRIVIREGWRVIAKDTKANLMWAAMQKSARCTIHEPHVRAEDAQEIFSARTVYLQPDSK